MTLDIHLHLPPEDIDANQSMRAAANESAG